MVMALYVTVHLANSGKVGGKYITTVDFITINCYLVRHLALFYVSKVNICCRDEGVSIGGSAYFYGAGLTTQ